MNKFDSFYMNVAMDAANLSHAIRRKVGAVAVRDGNIIAFGYNGTPAGDDNCCEYTITINEESSLVTKDTVIHAEENLVLKLARSTISSDGCTVYTTTEPCIRCARMLHGVGIARLVYNQSYVTSDGIEFLAKKGIQVEQL